MQQVRAVAPVWTIVVAGGRGERFGAPKQLLEVAGRRVLDWSVGAACSVSDGVVVVVPAESVDDAVAGATAVVAGGATRADSVRAGLAAVPEDAASILVHDAARPAASPELFARVVERLAAEEPCEGVVPVVPVTDSLRWVDGAAVDREQLVAVQTPQGFPAAVLRAAHAEGVDATDDASVVEAWGGTIVQVPGETTNAKLTHPGDVPAIEATLASRVSA